MIESLFTALNAGLMQSLWLAAIASLTWGILSILLSPCHLASIPLLVGFLTSQENVTKQRVFSLSATFAFGILVTIGIIGLVTALMGRLMGDVGLVGNILVAAIFFVIGLYLMDIISLPWAGMRISAGHTSGLTAALVLGLLFGIGLGPCTFAYMAPVLGVVFQTAANNMSGAVILLFAFALGHCAVIVVAGMLAGRIGEYLKWGERSKVITYIKRTCGLLVICGGIYMLWNVL